VHRARPLKRYVQRQLETKLGRGIIAGEIPDNSVVEVGVTGGELSFSARPSQVERAA
jgi:ATP-dependent Clp protease ATP-binding subunit ClpB